MASTVNDATIIRPAQASTGQASYTWAASTSDPRGLQKAVGTNRIAASWFGGQFTIDLNLTDGLSHKVALYGLD